MAKPNKYGLKRDIPADVSREVRSRCKFGCVVCRTGFYHYHHIDPPFKDAKEHDPDRICCLCANCHGRVERGHLSNAAVQKEYGLISAADPGTVPPAVGPLDFYDGTAELRIGGLSFNPAVRTVLRYHGTDIITVHPGEDGERGAISAVFTDGKGNETLWIDRNRWVGPSKQWDLEVTGSRLQVRRKRGDIPLRIRLDPPGVVVVERLDMRIGSAHILATEELYAVGRYRSDGKVVFHFAALRFMNVTPQGVAFQFGTPEELERLEPDAAGGNLVIGVNGYVYPKFGIAIGARCGHFCYGGRWSAVAQPQHIRRLLAGPVEKFEAFFKGPKK